MTKGTIVLIPFPFTDLSGQKVRPALVLYNQKTGDDCIVVFISSKKEKRGGIFDIPLSPTEQNGIKVDSTLKVSKIATLQKRIVIGELGRLEQSAINDVDTILKKLFEIQ